MKFPRVTIPLLLLGVLAGGAFWWAGSARDGVTATPPTAASASGEAPQPATTASPAEAAALERAQPTSPRAAAPPKPAPSASASTTLPEASSPLRDTIADLDRRARAGEAAAACRLAAELLQCERARMLQPYTDNVEGQARAFAQRNLPAPEMDRQIDAALQRQQQNAAALARCEGVDLAQWPPVARYFHLAAQAGHRPSMVQFLNAERFRSDQLFRDPELIALFRADAPRYFMTLLQEGDPELLQRWAMSAGMPFDVLHSVLPPPYNDAGFAAAMQDEMLRGRGITPPVNPALRDPPTPEQVEEAARVYQRYFAGKQPDENELRRRLASQPFDLAQYRCEE